MKKVSLILGIIVIIFFGGMGYMTYKNEQEKQEMIAIATSDEAKEIYEGHMKAQDPNALTEDGIIKSYEIDTESLYYNPMGGMEVTVFVNDNKDSAFHFGIVSDSEGNLQSNGYVIDAELVKILED